MEFTADISKYIDAGVELAKKHPVCTILVIILVLLIIVTPMIGSNWLDFLKKLKEIKKDKPASFITPPVEKPVLPSEVQPPKEKFDLADLDEEQIRVMQNLALMAKNRTLPFDVGEWIACDESTLDELVNTSWLTRTEKGYEVPTAVREVVLKDEVPVAAVEKFLDFVAHKKYFQDGEGYQAVQFKLGIVNDVLEKVEDRMEENQYTDSLYTSLGIVYYGQRAYTRAESYFKKAMNISIKMYGNDHSNTATRYGNLGLAYKQQGKYDEAVEQFLKAWNIRRQKLGMEHPDTESIKTSLRDCFPYIDHGDQDFDTWLSQQ